MSDARIGGRRGGAQPSAPGPGEGLSRLLLSMDGAPFGAYRRLLGRHEVGEFAVIVDRVPPDPYAGAARLRLVADRKRVGLTGALADSRARRIGVEDCLARTAEAALAGLSVQGANAPPGSGRIFLDAPGGAMVERGACRITSGEVELRLFVDLPAVARRIPGLAAEALFLSTLPRFGTSVLVFSARRAEEARGFAGVAEDHAAAQVDLARRGLVAFVADGSLLARSGGSDPGPRRDGREVPFEAPPALAVVLELPNAGTVRGLGVPAGVTLVVGGGFHGKSTLLDAIAAGVHPHPPGDGRERVVTVAGAVAVRAEDGRAVRRVDISGFLSDLPSGEPSADFSTERASGSTSQAAAISEALETGANLLLLDEDTSATNFMIRDGRMQRLVPASREPIVPFVDRVRDLYGTLGVSTILVTGGSGDYLEAADTVILMERYRAEDATGRARAIADATRTMRLREPVSPLRAPASREPRVDMEGVPARLRTGLRGSRAIRIGDDTVPLDALEQIAETGQVRALGALIREAARRMERGKDMLRLVEELDAWLDAEGIDALDRPAAYDLSRPRRHEIAAALNRWRRLRAHRPDRDFSG